MVRMIKDASLAAPRDMKSTPLPIIEMYYIWIKLRLSALWDFP